MKKYWIISSLAAMIISSCSVKPPREGEIVVDMAQKGAKTHRGRVDPQTPEGGGLKRKPSKGIVDSQNSQGKD